MSIDWAAVPLLAGVRQLADRGFITGASARNWAGYGSEINLPAGFADTDQVLLTDPQTSGGLLVSCDLAAVGAVINIFQRHGFGAAAVVGQVGGRLADLPAGTARLVVR